MERPAGARPAGNVGEMRGTGRGWGRAGLGLVLIVIPMMIGGIAAGADTPRADDDRLLKLGRELFLREWKPDDPAAMAVMDSGRCTTRPRAWPATAWAAPAGRGPSG